MRRIGTQTSARDGHQWIEVNLYQVLKSSPHLGKRHLVRSCPNELCARQLLNVANIGDDTR